MDKKNDTLINKKSDGLYMTNIFPEKYNYFQKTTKINLPFYEKILNLYSSHANLAEIFKINFYAFLPQNGLDNFNSIPDFINFRFSFWDFDQFYTPIYYLDKPEKFEINHLLTSPHLRIIKYNSEEDKEEDAIIEIKYDPSINNSINYKTFLKYLAFREIFVQIYDFEKKIPYGYFKFPLSKFLRPNKSKISTEQIELKVFDNFTHEEMISFLQLVHKAFYPLFLFYTKENDGLMSLNDFMKFTKDFEIFPYLIGKAKLNSMFNNISQYSSFTKNNTTYIEHSLFVDLIALMALDMIYPEPQPTPIEKLLIFIDKISQSAGQSKIVMRTGNYRSNNFSNFIDIFKEQYPEYFNINDDDGDNTNDDFENIMKSNYEENINDENENKNHDADNNKNENNNDIKDENENEKENNLQKNEININNNNIDS